MTRRRPLVVHVITRFARGGSEQRLVDAVRGADELDHHVIAGWVHDLAEARAAVAPATLELLPDLVRPPHPIRDPRASVALRRRLAALAPGVVMTHQSKAGALGRAVAARMGIPTVHSLSMASFDHGYPRPVRAVLRRVERALARSTTAFVAVGNDLAATYRRLGVPAERMHVVRSAARLPDPPEDAGAARRRLLDRCGLSQDHPVLAYVGSLDARKNVLDLVDVLADVRPSPGAPTPVLVVAGDGPEREALEDRAAQRGLGERVVLLGHVSDPTPVFHGADAVVLCSRAEGLPQVLVQAAASGTPFVAYEVSGTRELLAAGAVGRAVEWGRPQEAAAAVSAVLADRRPKRRTIDLSSWQPDAVGRAHARVLRSVIDPSGSGAATDRAA